MLTIYKASAGSGKTYSLALEYIKYLLGIKLHDSDRYVLNHDHYAPGNRRCTNRHNGILAITFTNAATEEMKSRIVARLHELASDTAHAQYFKPLQQLFGCTEAEMAESATLALSELLFDYRNFNVSTIDSFFQGVLRTFSQEIDYQGDYELCLNDDDAITQSVALMLDELNNNPDPTSRLYKWLSRQIVDSFEDKGTRKNFFDTSGRSLSHLVKKIKGIIDDTFREHEKALRDFIDDPDKINVFEKYLRDIRDSQYPPLQQRARDIQARMQSAGAELSDIKTFGGNLEMFLRDPKSLKTELFKRTIYKSDERELKTVSTTAIRKKFPGLFEELIDELFDLAHDIERAYYQYKYYDALIDSLGTLDIALMTQRKLDEYLLETNTVLLSGTGELLKRIISAEEIPFIYERMGNQLRHLLIDEFQDTSHLQWENLRPLISNSLAYGHDNLIIGDEKQAIYRFRNSDSTLLGHTVQEEDFPNDHQLRGALPSENTNHRSAADIVRFNNMLFRRLGTFLEADYYTNVVQTPCDALLDTPAYVRMEFVDKDVSEEETLEAMCQEILRQHNSGYRWSDIMILTRSNIDARKVVTYLLSQHREIKILSNEALLLSSSSAVRSIIAMLKLVSRSYEGKKAGGNPLEPEHIIASQGDIVMMITRFNYFISKGMQPDAALQAALETNKTETNSLEKQVMDIKAENPANLVALIDAVIAHQLSEEQRTEQYAYIAALQDLAIKHIEGAETSLAAFLDAYDRNEFSWAIKAPSNLDAIQVMTIHKSKGLERACVHIPFGDWQLTKGTAATWLEPEKLELDPDIAPCRIYINSSVSSVFNREEFPTFEPLQKLIKEDIIDSLNATYVAYTRASRELMVWSKTKNVGKDIFELLQLEDASEAGDSRILQSGSWNESRSVFTVGAPTVAPKAKEDTTNYLYTGEYPVIYRPDTKSLVSIDDSLAVHLDIGGEERQPVVDTEFESEQMKESARRGTALHNILSAMRSVDDIDRAISAESNRLEATPEEIEAYRNELREVFSHIGPLVKDWFDSSHRVYAERSLYVPETGKTYRPDRVVRRKDGSIVVIDYKFTSKTQIGHVTQVQFYMNLYRRMGFDRVEGYVWYPLLDSVTTVAQQ